MRALLPLLAALAASAEPPDPAFAYRERAYAAVRAHRHDDAVAAFRAALAANPRQPAVHKDLAYALLRVGETAAARDSFAAAAELDPTDTKAALEYAFLCHETGRTAAARRTFLRFRDTSDTARQAFENIDRPLRDGIARWRTIVERDSGNFSAHQELARLAEQHDEPALAAQHFEFAFRLRRDQRGLLLDLGRTLAQVPGQESRSIAVLLAASRGAEPYSAEKARALLPARYPYVYEFEQALDLDPDNVPLRRELAYLHLEMGAGEQARARFAEVLRYEPNDLLTIAQLGLLHLAAGERDQAMPLLQRVLDSNHDDLADRVREALQLPRQLRRTGAPRQQVSLEAKELADRSYEKGFLRDAVRYYLIAHENNPADFAVMLRLGWAHNLLRNDRTAAAWFRLATASPDTVLSEEARRAYRNLRPANGLRTTVWLAPLYSSRWRSAFMYGQIKTGLRLPRVPLQLYASARLDGDLRGTVRGSTALGPQYLSDSSVILALGVATPTWHRLTGWFEAGAALRYLPSQRANGLAEPDYRGGLNYARGWGRLGTEGHGWFTELSADVLYLHRFGRTGLLVTQTRTGYTLPGVDWLKPQLLWQNQVTLDSRGQQWANLREHGPNLRLRLPRWGQAAVTVGAMHGSYLRGAPVNQPSSYWDFRVGVWHAFTR